MADAPAPPSCVHKKLCAPTPRYTRYPTTYTHTHTYTGTRPLAGARRRRHAWRTNAATRRTARQHQQHYTGAANAASTVISSRVPAPAPAKECILLYSLYVFALLLLLCTRVSLEGYPESLVKHLFSEFRWIFSYGAKNTIWIRQTDKYASNCFVHRIDCSR